jgi:hypothetical protein
MFDAELDEFSRLVNLAGGGLTAFEAGRPAIVRGDSPRSVVDALKRNRPEAFDAKTALKRQRRESLLRR